MSIASVGVVRAQHLGGDITSAGQFSTISSDFVRTLTTGDSEESIGGSFHYLGPGNVFFEVTDPLHQIVLIKQTETLIFYPEKNNGFLFKGSGGMQILPMIPGIVASVRPDYGLGELGYELAEREAAGDTLVTIWSNKVAGDDLGRFRLAHLGNNLNYVVYFPPKNSVAGTAGNTSAPIKTTFHEYKLVGDFYIPHRLQTTTTTSGGVSVGTLQLSSLAVDRTIPDRVRNFQVPADARIEERSW